MKYLIVCAGDKSKFKVAFNILKFLIKKHKNRSNIFVCVVDADKKICKLLKKTKIKYISNNIKKFLSGVEKNHYDWLLNIWGPIIYKPEILQKFNKNLNLHPSFLPYAKGKDPYVWTVVNNFPIGVTIHEMSEKIDSGKYFLRKKINLKFPYTGGNVFDLTLKNCVNEFKKNWEKIRTGKLKKRNFPKIKTKTFKRVNLIKENLLDLDKPKNYELKNFVLKILSLDFKFNKLQVKLNKKIYDTSINLIKNKKKKWN